MPEVTEEEEGDDDDDDERFCSWARTSCVSTKRAGVARLIKSPMRVRRMRKKAIWTGVFVDITARKMRGHGRRMKEVNVGRRGP